WLPAGSSMRYVTYGAIALVLLPIALLTVALACRSAAAQSGPHEFEGWDLESSVEKAHLVMVARVVRISQVAVVEGAKTDVALREFRFQPVQTLKGIFHRDELSMTASDLGISSGDAAQAPPLTEGEFRLLILTQQSGFGSLGPGGTPTYGCVTAAPGANTFDERVPLVSGPDDPLIGVIETLIRVADSRSRRARAELLVDRLSDLDGLAAVPLLSSLYKRADWAAIDARAYTAVARLAADSRTPVRMAALRVLCDMLASGITPEDPPPAETIAGPLREILESEEAIASVRLAALTTLGHFLTCNPDLNWPRDLLVEQLNTAKTYAERAAALTALSYIDDPRVDSAVLDALRQLPLDESPAREAVYIQAALRVDSEAAEEVLVTRLEQSIAARQSLTAEIEPLGRMRSKASLPLLLDAANQYSLATADRQQLPQALGRLGDDRAVPALIRLFDDDNNVTKENALAALEAIDSTLAAREVRPLVRSEAGLTYKLRLSRLVARHGYRDGYSLATEHLADNDQTAPAALVLIALDDPRMSDDLTAILTAQPDSRWRAAALTGLAALGDDDAVHQLREILAEDRHPLAAEAAEAAGLTTESELLIPLADLVDSRNQKIATAALVALHRFFSKVRTAPEGLSAIKLNRPDQADGELPIPAAEVPPETRAAIFDAVAALAADAYVDQTTRQLALTVARLVGRDRYSGLLANLADQAELEGSKILEFVRSERRNLKR
ncbi:MAG: HEAT repeat domain-containing protein, partial [Pirellulales bacterium]